MRRSHQWFERELRGRIRRGTYAPGSRLPSHRQFLEELGGSSVTIQRAFDRLVEQGWVEPRGTLGTFVAAALPDSSRVALVFPEQVGQGGWNRFWATVRRVADGWSEGDTTFVPYAVVGQGRDCPGFHQLRRDLKDGGLVGVVFFNNPTCPVDLPEQAGVPWVLVGAGRDGGDDERGSLVHLVERDVIGRLLQRFAAGGRRRLAGLSVYKNAGRVRAACAPFLSTLGLETRPEWWLELPINTDGVDCVRGVARLLVSGPPRERPDCLLVADDNLVPAATSGILDAGRRVPIELEIAAHANFPGPTHAAVPCLRFGTDVAALLRLAVAEIAHLAAGGARRDLELAVEIREGAAART